MAIVAINQNNKRRTHIVDICMHKMQILASAPQEVSTLIEITAQGVHVGSVYANAAMDIAIQVYNQTQSRMLFRYGESIKNSRNPENLTL